jgi:hypothetical protein
MPGHFVNHSIDMSALVRRSVASLYSHLVTRPTGQALRMGIESQLSELGEFCVSVLDFTQVIVLDYSCADEAVAKLILRYQRDDRPAEAYFVARGVAEQHLEPIEAVLGRHNLALVADVEELGFCLLGAVSEEERRSWIELEKLGYAPTPDVARHAALTEADTSDALTSLSRRRAVVRRADTYFSLSTLLART